jgi:hypothetical protein
MYIPKTCGGQEVHAKKNNAGGASVSLPAFYYTNFMTQTSENISGFSLKPSGLGLKDFRLGLKDFRHGLKVSGLGLKDFRHGLKASGLGLKDFRYGLKVSGHGLKQLSLTINH